MAIWHILVDWFLDFLASSQLSMFAFEYEMTADLDKTPVGVASLVDVRCWQDQRGLFQIGSV